MTARAKDNSITNGQVHARDDYYEDALDILAEIIASDIYKKFEEIEGEEG